MLLQGKNALVTGGSQGIGAAISLDLAREGGSSKALNTAMIGVLAELGRLGLPDAAFRLAIASQFAGKDRVGEANLQVYARARAWAAQAGV